MPKMKTLARAALACAASLAVRPATAQHFTPAANVIVAEDFSGGRLTPQSGISIVSGSGEVTERDGREWFSTREGATLHISLPGMLPRSFTLEADLLTDQPVPLNVEFASGGTLRCGMNGVRVETNGASGGEDLPGERTVPVRCQLRVEGGHVQAWIDDQPLADVANAAFQVTRELEIRVPSGAERPTLFGGFRLATGEAVAAAPTTPLGTSPTARSGTGVAGMNQPAGPVPLNPDFERRLEALEAQNRQLTAQVTQLQQQLHTLGEVATANVNTLTEIVCQHAQVGDQIAGRHFYFGLAVPDTDPHRLIAHSNCSATHRLVAP